MQSAVMSLQFFAKVFLLELKAFRRQDLAGEETKSFE
jgi:hypothetical protein